MFDISEAHDYLSRFRAASFELGITERDLPGIPIQPTVGWDAVGLLDILVRLRQPHRILEIGTSYGFAACGLGKAAESYGGHVTSIEIRHELVEAARRNAAHLGLTNVEIFEADVRNILPNLTGRYGLILQDGDKMYYELLLDPLVERLEPGGILISDDILFPVMDLPETVQNWKTAMDRYNERLYTHPLLRTIWLPLGDGIAISLK